MKTERAWLKNKQKICPGSYFDILRLVFPHLSLLYTSNLLTWQLVNLEISKKKVCLKLL